MTIILPLPTGQFNAKTREYKIMLKPGTKRELHGRKCKGEKLGEKKKSLQIKLCPGNQSIKFSHVVIM